MPRAMTIDDKKFTDAGAWLRAGGLSAREAQERLNSGKVWVQSTPIWNPRRQWSPDLALDDRRPRFNPRAEPAVTHRDVSFCIAYKPSGLLSVPAPGRREPSVLRAVERWFGRAFAVHRIDEGTSGLLCVALSESAQVAIKAQFEAHTITRRYLAWVHGRFPAGMREVNTGLVRDRGDGRRGVVPLGHPDAKPARTQLRLVANARGGSLVEATLHTGRTHQVRLHLAHLGFPIAGDPLYGKVRSPRLMLHATHLGLAHPDTRAPLSWNSPLPDDFLAISGG